MQNFNFLEKELLDIIFKGRNQQYGAYVLRKNYPQRIKNAMLLTGVFLLSLVGVYFATDFKNIPGITPPTFDPPDPVIEIKKLIMPVHNDGKAGQIEKIKPPVNNQKQYKIVDQTTPIKPLEKNVEKITPPIVSTGAGEKTGPSTEPPGMGGTSKTGIGPQVIGTPSGTPVKTAKEFKPLEIAQNMPEYPGGDDALMRFLGENIKYPKMASSIGVAGTVYVEFVVGATGEITNVHVLNSVGAGCDKEAMRVIKSMPIWKPGMQDGHKVPVLYRIPVEFSLDQ